MTEAWLAHLQAMQAHLDALVLTAQREMGIQAPAELGSCPNCKAPPEQVESTKTYGGGVSYHCKCCGHDWEGT